MGGLLNSAGTLILKLLLLGMGILEQGIISFSVGSLHFLVLCSAFSRLRYDLFVFLDLPVPYARLPDPLGPR